MVDERIAELRERVGRIQADLDEVRESLEAIESSQEEAAPVGNPGDEQLRHRGLVEELLSWVRESPEEGLQGVPPDASVRLDEYLYGGKRD